MSAARTRSALPWMGAVPPLSLAVSAPSAPYTAEQLLAPHARLAMVVTPLLREVLTGAGAQATSANAFTLRAPAGSPALAALAAAVPAGVWAPSSAVAAARVAGALHQMDQQLLHAQAAAVLGTDLPELTPGAPAPTGRVLVRRSGRTVHVRVAADDLLLAGVNLSSVLTPGRRPARVLPHVALLAVDEALAAGLLVVDANGTGQVAQLRRALAAAVVVLPSGSGAGVADVVTGAHSRDPGVPGGKAAAEQSPAVRRRGSVQVAVRSAADAVATPARLSAIHPEVADVARMAQVASTSCTGAVTRSSAGATGAVGFVGSGTGDGTAPSSSTPAGLALRDYQQRAVDLHAVTTRGYVNLSAPGLGKTVMALVGMRTRALGSPRRWRGVISAPAAVREQWHTEALRWFPEADLITVRTRADAAALSASLRTAAGTSLVIISHELLPEAAPSLLAVRFDDVMCDEATLLRNPASTRGRVLWKLRERAQVAVALTGTPPAEQLSQVTALAAWCRNRPELLAAPAPASVAQLVELLGPVLFRQDQRALDGEVDVAATTLLDVPATALEQQSAQEALAAARDALAAWEGAPRSVKARLRPAASASLTRARLALSDPLAGTESAAAGSKRQVLTSLLTAGQLAGQSTLVFTDFTPSAAAALGDAAAAQVRVGALTGGQSRVRRARVVEQFTAGELSALIVTPAGQEGLNLQRADTVVHLDLPLEVGPVLQRQSRARRIGGTHSVSSVALVAGPLEHAAALAVLAELAAELTGSGRLEGGAGGVSALHRAVQLLLP